MKLNAIMGISAALCCVGGAGQVSAFEPGQTDVNAVVMAVMDDAYGETYDASSACWQFTFNDEQGESTDYCMRPGKPRVASGGTWQGVTVSNFSIVTEINGQIRDVSRIPQIREEAQNIKYEVNVKAEPSARSMLPLHVVETEVGAVANEFDVAFDSQRGVYALPGRRSARPATP